MLTIQRTESVIVDPVDPSAALAVAATEMVVGLVRRAKSTRGPRRMDSSAGPVRRERTRSLDLPTHMNQLESQGQTERDADPPYQTTLRSRPSLRNRLKSRLGNRPAAISISPAVPCADPKTPTDPQFRYRPKRGGADLSHLAATLQVPRDSQDGDGEPSPTYKRLSFEKSDQDILSMGALPTSKSEPIPSPTHLSPALSPDLDRAPGECRRCHSKRVQRTLSARDASTAAERTFGVPTPLKRPNSDGSTTKDVFNDYKFTAARPESGDKFDELSSLDRTASYPIVFIDDSIPSPHYEAVASEDNLRGEQTRQVLRQAPSWASYGEDDNDAEKVEANGRNHRKSLQPLLSNPVSMRYGSGVPQKREEIPTELPPRTLRRQRSVAQRIVDYIRPTPKRSGSVRGAVKAFF